MLPLPDIRAGAAPDGEELTKRQERKDKGGARARPPPPVVVSRTEKQTAAQSLAAGIAREDLSPRPLPPPQPPPQGKTPRGGVGDAAAVNLNAAALQTLSMPADAQPDYRVYRGQILPSKPGKLLDGGKSHDVSYIADQRTGAGRARVSSDDADKEPSSPTRSEAAEVAAAIDAAVAMAGAPRLTPRPPAKSDRGGGRRERFTRAPAEPLPSSRAEAVIAASELRRALSELPEQREVGDEIGLWNVCAQLMIIRVFAMRDQYLLVRACGRRPSSKWCGRSACTAASVASFSKPSVCA